MTVRVRSSVIACIGLTCALAAGAQSSRGTAHRTRARPRGDDMVLFSGGSVRVSRPQPPSVEVTVAPFWLDRTEVTVQQYAACVRARRCSRPSGAEYRRMALDNHYPGRLFGLCNWGHPERQTHPINCVDGDQAEAYCRWRGASLPTEAEWICAAGGCARTEFPWGNDPPSAERLNAGDIDKGLLFQEYGGDHMFDWHDGFAATAPVGSFPSGATSNGVLDLQGNVSEYVEALPEVSSEPRDFFVCGVGGVHIGRCASWRGASFEEAERADLGWDEGQRACTLESQRMPTNGFRCARALRGR